jgi:hypothetical protein
VYNIGLGPSITPLTLTQSGVSPSAGTAMTTFTFSTTYTDAAGAAPAQALLYVDQQPYAMTHISGAYSSGALFQTSLLLPVGSHQFSLVFADATSSWADPLGPAQYAGPTVSALGAPAAVSNTPLQVIAPNHDVNPDYPMPGDGDG